MSSGGSCGGGRGGGQPEGHNRGPVEKGTLLGFVARYQLTL